MSFACTCNEAKTSKFNYTQVDEARAKVSETSTKMYNSVLDAHEKSKDFDKKLKELTKEIQGLVKEKEAVEKRRTEAIKRRTELELDVKDLEEKISGNMRAKVLLLREYLSSITFRSHPSTENIHTIILFLFIYSLYISICFQEDAGRQLQMLQKEIQDSSDELDKISPIYDNQVIEEKEISKGFVYEILLVLLLSSLSCFMNPTPRKRIRKKRRKRGEITDQGLVTLMPLSLYLVLAFSIYNSS